MNRQTITKFILCYVVYFYCTGFLLAQPKGFTEVSCTMHKEQGIETMMLQQYQRTMGYAIWMNPDQVKTTYLIDRGTYRTIHARFKHWKKQMPVLLSTSGNYVNKSFHQSIGLTVDKGKAINKMVADDMDALVITLNGSLTIFNVEQPFELPGLGRKINAIRDKIRLLSWAERSKASMFQTHLLVFENQLSISTKGNLRQAKRKFLATVYNQAGQKQQVLVYLQRGEFLQKATKKVFDYLQSKDYYVYAMVNLDTGGNDVLTLDQTISSCKNKTIKGFMPIHYATSLLVFYGN